MAEQLTRTGPRAATPAGGTGPTRARSLRHRNARLAYLFIAPAVLLIGVLVLYPLVRSIWDSLHVDNLLNASHEFAGLANYRTVVTDPAFHRAALNTVGYFLLASIASLVIGMVMASWLHSIRRGRAVFFVLLILPWAIPGTVSGVLWALILNPSAGLLNGVLQAMHLISAPHVWLKESVTSIVFVSLSLIWQIAPISGIILLAGIESIPRDLYESIAMDGAGTVRTFTRLTLPLLRPAIAISMVNAGVLGIGVFDQVYVLTGNAPGTISAIQQTYLYAFRDLNFGVGIAASIFVTVATLLISVAYLKGVYREVEYA